MTIMSQRSLILPQRFFPQIKPHYTRWICRRCLTAPAATQAQPPSDPPVGNPRSSHREQTKIATLLSTPITAKIPPQLLCHSTSSLLPLEEQEQRAATRPHKEITGVVVSSGKMQKTVKVRVQGQKWNSRIKKFYADPQNHLVHDPNSSLATGDVVKLHRLHVSKRVRHVVSEIVAPFGTPVESRPPIPTADERLAQWKEHRLQKRERKAKADEARAKVSRTKAKGPKGSAKAAVNGKGDQ
ncbi:nucleic acid-binding protein [Piedraia hortae CBS 480.64]|uniref:Nucleic acid-binding protein n=1 Tax=Piedraia hortae CBS 480.64 TaxID=1314780 RepID=A0A6A7BUQ8_9PEZI|nr:nucleic acid-binding protein [Piedraia hortae CBS 480.64]